MKVNNPNYIALSGPFSTSISRFRFRRFGLHRSTFLADCTASFMMHSHSMTNGRRRKLCIGNTRFGIRAVSLRVLTVVDSVTAAAVPGINTVSFVSISFHTISYTGVVFCLGQF